MSSRTDAASFIAPESFDKQRLVADIGLHRHPWQRIGAAAGPTPPSATIDWKRTEAS